jgi:hypothetical protein
MKFFIVTDCFNKRSIVGEKVIEGITPDEIHSETYVSKDFFMQVPIGYLTRRLETKYNEELEQKILKSFDQGLCYSHKSKHGTRVVTNKALYETPFEYMPGLKRLSINHTEIHKIDINLDEYKPVPGEVDESIQGVDEGYEKITVQRHLVDGASFDTIKLASEERKIGTTVHYQLR